MQQPSFDLINAVGHAYHFVWHNRRNIGRLVLLPLIIGLLCYSVVALLDYEQKYLRQAIILLPAFFAEGWMIVYLIRFIFRDPDKKTAVPMLHADKNMQIGIVMYVLIKYLLFGVMGLMWMSFDEAATLSLEGEPSSRLMAITVSIMFVALLFFRFFWLYIPAVLGITLKSYLYHTRGFQVTLQMAGVWLISFMPFFLLFSFVGSIVVSPYEGVTPLPLTPKIILTTLQLFMELLVDIVSTASIAYGIKALYFGEDKSV